MVLFSVRGIKLSMIQGCGGSWTDRHTNGDGAYPVSAVIRLCVARESPQLLRTVAHHLRLYDDPHYLPRKELEYVSELLILYSMPTGVNIIARYLARNKYMMYVPGMYVCPYIAHPQHSVLTTVAPIDARAMIHKNT